MSGECRRPSSTLPVARRLLAREGNMRRLSFLAVIGLASRTEDRAAYVCSPAAPRSCAGRPEGEVGFDVDAEILVVWAPVRRASSGGVLVRLGPRARPGARLLELRLDQ